MAIDIKPENRGKFTASAKRAGQGVQEHARSVLANPNATGLQKKRANFARNAAKWNKQDGGQLGSSSFSEDAKAMGHTIAQHAAHIFQDGGILPSSQINAQTIQRTGQQNGVLNQGFENYSKSSK
jgi:hypothetical protein